MAKIFITGVNGFVGGHLADLYDDEEVLGLVLTKKDDDRKNIKYFEGNILDYEKISSIISSEKPDVIYHLAAFTSPGESLKSPVETLDNNIKGQLNILEAIRNAELFDSKTLVVSSAEVYGNVDEKDLPISEDAPLQPMTPYAVSKVAQDFLGYQYFNAYGVKAVRVRPFNHIGPGQAPLFVVSAFAKQIAMIEKGKQEKVMKVGNLTPKRDFTDVRDVVRAYKLLINKGKIGDVYNIGSGKSYEISEILNILLSFSSVKIDVQIDKSLIRKVDIKELRCDITKIKNDTGWEPSIDIKKTLRDSLDYWREIV